MKRTPSANLLKTTLALLCFGPVTAFSAPKYSCTNKIGDQVHPIQEIKVELSFGARLGMAIVSLPFNSPKFALNCEVTKWDSQPTLSDVACTGKIQNPGPGVDPEFQIVFTISEETDRKEGKGEIRAQVLRNIPNSSPYLYCRGVN